jgi:CPA2 family monovalent cation:H+ antiporter-2
MLFDPAFVVANVWKISALVLLVFVMKAIVIGVSTRAFGYVNLAPWIVGLGLSQIGEFSFVLARIGLTGGAISKATYELVLTCTVLTMAISPMVSSLALPLGRRWKGRRSGIEGYALPSIVAARHFVVAGFGRSGQGALDELQGRGERVLIVESDYQRYREAVAGGCEVIWGDITREEIQVAAQITEAKALLLTMPDEDAVEVAMEQARRLNPRLRVVARAVNGVQAENLQALGTDAVIQPEREGGVALARAAITSSD